ncbi:hypothetical protein ACFYYM_40305 [Streptomyces erythrochromogenes]|uniref:hypothetical protein n=1 Tax=Streptomyces erythrochromogenes TaxID=285574 RepID=UPI00369805EB
MGRARIGRAHPGRAGPVIEAAQQLGAGIDTLRERRDARLQVAAGQDVAEYLFPRWLVARRASAGSAAITLESGNSVGVAQAAPESRTVAADRAVVVVAPRASGIRASGARRSEIPWKSPRPRRSCSRSRGPAPGTSFERTVPPACLPAGLADWRTGGRRGPGRRQLADRVGGARLG